MIPRWQRLYTSCPVNNTSAHFRPNLPQLHRRTLCTTRIRYHPVANSPFPGLLQRDPERNLPSLASLNPRRRWLRTMPIFIAILTVSALGIFNYQRSQSPIITATLYALRTNATVREVLGDEVYFESKWAWIWGSINFVQGRIDVRFRVKGSREAALCRFKAVRVGGKSGQFVTENWSLTTDDGKVLHLLQETEGLDPAKFADA